MKALKHLLTAACVVLAPAATYAAEKNAAGYLSYRTVDVTSIKILARLWYGEGAVFPKPQAGEHDALVDIKNSIAELSHYRATLFKK